MATDIHRELGEGLCSASPARLSFTRKAFQMLPKLDKPQILDVGCGQGGPTLELARLSGGQVTGLDIDRSALDELAMTAEAEGLSDRVQVVRCSMREIDFPDGSFDIIWAEGSMHLLGFARALRDWQRFIKPRGFLVAHEMAWLRPDPPQEIRSHWQAANPGIRTVPEYIEQVTARGYDLIGHFTLPEDFWWVDYYAPLEARIRELAARYALDRSIQRVLDREQGEVDLYKRHSRWYGSAFLVMQRSNSQVKRAATHAVTTPYSREKARRPAGVWGRQPPGAFSLEEPPACGRGSSLGLWM
jgi:SAM-dependent methyltransferase